MWVGIPKYFFWNRPGFCQNLSYSTSVGCKVLLLSEIQKLMWVGFFAYNKQKMPVFLGRKFSKL